MITEAFHVRAMCKEAISLVIFFIVVSFALILNTENFSVFSPSRKSRLKNRPEENERDMFIVRPGGPSGEVSPPIEIAPPKPPLASRSSISKTHGSSEVEIHNSIAAAKRFVDQGKLDKAIKVYQHIVKLHPKHPDVLTAYGQLLEEGYDDVVEAEHLYSAALIESPSHERAAERRRRTLPLVEKIDQKNFNRVSQKMKQLSKISRHNPGLRRAKIEAYIQHIYHTNAMEGNTMTLMQTRAIVETGIAVGGKSVYEHNEVLGMDAALQYINKTQLHQAQFITVNDILEIHKRVLGFVNLEEAGRFRQTQVFVGSHRPPPPAELEAQVEDFVDWLNAEREEDAEATGLHPLELAALAHYKFVFIHPFYDGNGRVSRLLMNLVLLQAGYPPVIINVEDKHEYYQRLQLANDGDVRPFIRFVADCTERTLDHYLMASSASSSITVPGHLNPKTSSDSWTFTTERRKDGKKKIVLSHQPPRGNVEKQSGRDDDNEEPQFPSDHVDADLGLGDEEEEDVEDDDRYEDPIIEEN